MRWQLGLTMIAFMAISGCGPTYLPGTQIEATPEREELAQIVERYRVALEQRDPDALRRLVSYTYYENASTTEDPNDDYDVNGLEKVLADLRATVRAVKYEIDITQMNVLEDAATVDFDYRSQYMFIVGEQERWHTASDRNRLTFRREKGEWKITSGL